MVEKENKKDQPVAENTSAPVAEPAAEQPQKQQDEEQKSREMSASDVSSQNLDSSSIHEDAPEQPRFVPLASAASDADGNIPLIMMRKTTLKKNQIEVAATSKGQEAEEHNTLLDCILCKNVMVDARECSKCKRGFCKRCVDDYIDQLIQGEYQVLCPNCSTTDFKLGEPHPLLLSHLKKIRARCENEDKGCTVIVNYSDLASHQKACDYAIIKCTNYGCEAEMFQKDWPRHNKTCEHRVHRCDKCEVVIAKDKLDEHDCTKSMAAKFEYLEGKLNAMGQRLELELERAERKRLSPDFGTQLIRQEIALPQLAQVKFDAANGFHQQMVSEVAGLPAHTRGIILRFGLTDINVRRDYGSLIVYQAGSANKIDFTNYFFVGPMPLPPFGQMTEVMMPWEENLDQQIIVEFQVALNQQPNFPGGPIGGWGGMPHYRPNHSADMGASNPYAYATFSIGGIFHKK